MDFFEKKIFLGGKCALLDLVGKSNRASLPVQKRKISNKSQKKSKKTLMC